MDKNNVKDIVDEALRDAAEKELPEKEKAQKPKKGWKKEELKVLPLAKSVGGRKLPSPMPAP